MFKRLKCLAIVFWEPNDHWKASTTIYVVEGNPDPKFFNPVRGMSISKMFKKFKIPIEIVRKTFPGCIIVSENKPEEIPKNFHWGMPLDWQNLPCDQEGLKPLADLVKMPIIVFESHRCFDATNRWGFSYTMPRCKFKIESTIV